MIWYTNDAGGKAFDESGAVVGSYSWNESTGAIDWAAGDRCGSCWTLGDAMDLVEWRPS